MKISVAMCTFNGEAYLEEQLLSLLQQSYAAHEIICCDDGSTDRTVGILEKYAASYPGLFRIIQNDKNVGPRKNFEKAISCCNGDIIFLCDQDDRWMTNKIERTIDVFEQQRDLLGVFTNGRLIDKEGEMLGETMWDALYFEPSIRDKCAKEDMFLYLLLNGNIATGTAMAIRKEAIPFILPFYTVNNTWHDHWIALVLSAINRLDKLDESLLEYRVHDEQQVGFPGRRKSNPVFRDAVHHTWLQSHDPGSLEVQAAHLAWGLQSWELFFPLIKERIGNSMHMVVTGEKIKSRLTQTKTLWIRQLPWLTRKLKLVKHWLKGGEYLRISFSEVISI